MRVLSESELAAVLRQTCRDDCRVVVAGNFATPWRLLSLLDRTLETFRTFSLNAHAGWPCREGVRNETPFLGPGLRHDPRVHYVPARLSLVPALFQSRFPPDVVLLHTSPPYHGRVSLGIEVNILPAAIEMVRQRGGLVLAQINPQMPYTFGDSELDESLVDYAVEADDALDEPEPHVLDPVSAEIGERVSHYVRDGATLQLGIGAIPNAAVSHICPRRGLGVWSEMISDGIVALERHGSLRASEPISTSFLFGSSDLYTWCHRNERLVMRRTEIVNSPSNIAAQPAMFSLNAAVQVDLSAQANATHVRGAIYSGFGGQPDFVVGALHSHGGHAIIAVRSWHESSDSSCVLPLLTSPVCTFQHSLIASEHGVAEIFGRSDKEQRDDIIDHVADPRAREHLSTVTAHAL